MNKTNLPNNLYELRRKANLSQEDFAERLGVSRQAVSKWERGEAYPDTDNLITISGMFGVTIDELLNSADIFGNSLNSDTESEANSSEAAEGTEEATDGSFRVNIGDRVINLNGAISVDNDDGKVKIDLDNGNIIVDDDEDHVTVNLGGAGISVNTDDGVKIKLGKGGIHINDGDDDDDDDDEGRSSWKYSMLYSAPYSVICVAAFLILGFTLHAWSWAWTLFMTIPIYDSLLDVIRKKRLTSFSYTVFVAFLYCLFGMLYAWWHPGWIIFLTIPVYYPIASAIDRYIHCRKK